MGNDTDATIPMATDASKRWHDNGKFNIIDGFYTNGKNDGIKKMYYKSGVLKYER